MTDAEIRRHAELIHDALTSSPGSTREDEIATICLGLRLALNAARRESGGIRLPGAAA